MRVTECFSGKSSSANNTQETDRKHIKMCVWHDNIGEPVKI